jgi:hypothetical protein
MVAGGSSLHHGEERTHLQPVPVPVAAMTAFYTPDDGRMAPETCRESFQE